MKLMTLCLFLLFGASAQAQIPTNLNCDQNTWIEVQKTDEEVFPPNYEIKFFSSTQLIDSLVGSGSIDDPQIIRFQNGGFFRVNHVEVDGVYEVMLDKGTGPEGTRVWTCEAAETGSMISN